MHEQPTLPFLESQSSSRPPDFIPVYTPDIGRREQELVNELILVPGLIAEALKQNFCTKASFYWMLYALHA